MTDLRQADYALAFDEAYRITDADQVLTPALAVYPEIVEANIAATLRLLNGDPNRWRPHVKTAKLGFIMRRLVENGVVNFKCATTLELLTACEAGATDILLAYPVVGANARRVREIARLHPEKQISALVENEAQVAAWAGSKIGLFIDVNPGMNRTGLEQARGDEIVRVARAITASGLAFRGLHYYDGHVDHWEPAEREARAHQGYDQLMEIAAALESAGMALPEVITAGTPALPCSLSYSKLAQAPFLHRVSPGTVVYGDYTSLGQLPRAYGYRLAALVVSTVVSHPTPQRITCDAGHKTVSADAGVPTCGILGHPELEPAGPSEEHLPIDIPPASAAPAIGELLYLLPRHICPTVNNFDHALLVVGGRIAGVERVTARGREAPIKSDSSLLAGNSLLTGKPQAT
jgi:D-serine deaminase-like pyridoxal phosphate-dependent protein